MTKIYLFNYNINKELRNFNSNLAAHKNYALNFCKFVY